MIPLVLAAALVFGGPTTTTPGPEIRVIRAADPRHRFARLHGDLEVAGVRGTAVSLYDLDTGRFADSVDAGVLSFRDGFDGARVWSADATGMPQIEGNADLRLDALAWAHFFGRPGPERPQVERLRATRTETTVQIRYPELSGTIDVTLDPISGHVRTITDDRGFDRIVVHYHDYRTIAGVPIPFRIDTTDSFRVTHERIRSVDFPAMAAGEAFAPPPPPHDVHLVGITTVRMAFDDGRPIIPIRINNGPTLHVMFDSGSTNYLKPATAKRLGLRLTGDDRSGGVGPGLVRQRYTAVERLRIGEAELRHQPFAVLDDGSSDPHVDGTIGCEVLQRFAVRFDFANATVALAPDVSAFNLGAPAIPLRMTGCVAEIDGALDDLSGPLAIDTGSANGLDIMAPFARAHDLLTRYRAPTPHVDGGGIGGATIGSAAFARSVRLGNVTQTDVPIELSTMERGAFNDPTQIGNVGIPLLRHYVTVFDYRGGRMWLLR